MSDDHPAPPPGLGVPGCPVTLGTSAIPGAGRGLFAARDLARGDLLGVYFGVVQPSADPAPEGRHLYGLALDGADEGRSVYPDPYLPPQWPDGPPVGAQVPHLANDAVHLEVTGRRNNAHFTDLRMRGGSTHTCLVASRPVAAGGEILVTYGWEYWSDIGGFRDTRVLRICALLGEHTEFRMIGDPRPAGGGAGGVSYAILGGRPANRPCRGACGGAFADQEVVVVGAEVRLRCGTCGGGAGSEKTIGRLDDDGAAAAAAAADGVEAMRLCE